MGRPTRISFKFLPRLSILLCGAYKVQILQVYLIFLYPFRVLDITVGVSLRYVVPPSRNVNPLVVRKVVRTGPSPTHTTSTMTTTASIPPTTRANVDAASMGPVRGSVVEDVSCRLGNGPQVNRKV